MIEGEVTSRRALRDAYNNAMLVAIEHFDRENDVAWHYATVPVPQGVVGNEDAPIDLESADGNPGFADRNDTEGDDDGEAND